ncbi:MAG: TetR/AcrR family transcriptional regulator [Firmicutes bacterium]|nr:TetR/AcrR family transcriptional regulator [Bacillota bacterium]
MGRPPLTDEENKKIKIRLIEAARQILLEDNETGFSVRNVSKISGINSALVYKHFSDAEELIMFASFDLLKDYNMRRDTITTTDPTEQFLEYWAVFSESVFDYAPYMYNLYYGKHSHNVTDIMKQYFELFPQSRKPKTNFGDHQVSGNLFEHNRTSLMPILKDRLDEETIEQINQIIGALFASLLQEKIRDPQIPNKVLSQRMVNYCKLLLRIN